MFHYPQEPINLRTALGEPDIGDARQKYMWEALQGRQNCFLLDGKCDLEEWRRTANRLTDHNLAGQAKASLSRGLQLSGDAAGAWELVSSLYADLETYDKPTRGIIYFHVLSFLNRRKSAEQLPQFRRKEELASHVRRYSLEALKLALELENVTFVASTVFYLTKALETVEPASDERSLSSYIAALRFVEHASPIRALQSILSQGSVHRHYAFRSQVSLSWQEAVQHIDEAFRCNRRAFATAVNSRNTMHQLNAASYCGELCLSSLARASSDEAHHYLRQQVAETMEMYHYILAHYQSDDEVGVDSRHIYWTIRHTWPLIEILQLFYSEGNSDRSAWQKCGEILGDEFRSRGSRIRTLQYRDRAKAYSELLKNALKVRSYLAEHEEQLGLFKLFARPAVVSLSTMAANFVARDRQGDKNQGIKRLRTHIRTVEEQFK